MLRAIFALALSASAVDAGLHPIDENRFSKRDEGKLLPTLAPGSASLALAKAEARPKGIAPSRLLRRAACIYGACTLALSPLLTPERVDLALGVALPAPLRDACMSACVALHALRSSSMLGCVFLHEIATDLTADVMAQAIDAPGSTMQPDWRRVPRSAAVSWLTDDLPFLLWSSWLWAVSEHAIAAVRASRSLSPALAHALTSVPAVALFKTLITQLVYETLSNAAYLALQCGLRGGDLHAIVAELRAKLWTVWRDGLAFWSVAHMVVFAQPIWWLQPFLGNLFTLVFNVYLAVTAHRPVQPPVQPPPPQLWNEQQQQTLQSQGLVSDSPPDAGGHELFHHPGRLVEAAAWQSALHRRQREGQPARSA